MKILKRHSSAFHEIFRATLLSSHGHFEKRFRIYSVTFQLPKSETLIKVTVGSMIKENMVAF